MKDLLNLAEKAANYKRGGNHLLHAINEVGEILESFFEDYVQFRFIHERVAYLANVASSNVGEYGPALCYVQDSCKEPQRFKPMPSQWSSSGDGFYLHNDFKAWIDTATRAEIVKVAETLPAFLGSLADFLEEKGAVNDKSATEIAKIASNLRDATKLRTPIE